MRSKKLRVFPQLAINNDEIPPKFNSDPNWIDSNEETEKKNEEFSNQSVCMHST